MNSPQRVPRLGSPTATVATSAFTMRLAWSGRGGASRSLQTGPRKKQTPLS